MQSTLLQLSEPADFISIAKQFDFNYASLKQYGSKLGITSKHNYTRQILADIETGVPNKYEPYYTNMINRNLAVQLYIRSTNNYPNIVRTFLTHAHTLAIPLDVTYSLLARQKALRLEQRRLKALQEDARLEKLAEKQAQDVATRSMVIQQDKDARARARQEENELATLGDVVGAEIVIAMKHIHKTSPAAKRLTDGWVSRIAEITGAKESSIRVYESRAREQLSIEPHVILQAIDDGDTIDTIARRHKTTREIILSLI